MPTSAAASAGASLMPSPAIATMRSLRLQFLDQRVLVGRQHFGAKLGNAQLLGHRGRGRMRRRRSPSRRARRSALSSSNADSCRRLDRIGNREQSEQSVFSTDEHDRAAFAAQVDRRPSSTLSRSMPASLMKRALPRRSRPSVAVPCTPRPVTDSKSSTAIGVTERSLRERKNRARERMLARCFEACSRGDQFVFADPGRSGTTWTTRGLPSVKRAGLVDDQRIDLLHRSPALPHRAPARPSARHGRRRP